MKRSLLISTLFLLFLNGIKAQEIEINESGSWYTLVNKLKMTDKLYVQNVMQWRFVDFAENTRIFLIMPSVNYKFNKKITAGVGYNYVNYNQHGAVLPTLDYENRIWQHISLFSYFGKVKMSQRFMMEERFRVRNVTGAKSYTNRFRYRINLDFNILKFGNEKHLITKLSNEVRVRFSSGVSDPKFDQNNFVALLGYQLLDNSKIYAGYGRDYYHAGAGYYWGDNLLQVMFFYDFDIRKKKNK